MNLLFVSYYTKCIALGMNIRNERFTDVDIEENFHGAGVVPVAYDTQGTPHVLLGRERFTQQYKGSCRWSGFEGTRKHGEGVYDTALRESYEESLGCIGNLLCDRCTRLVMNVTFPSKCARYHVTYMMFMSEYEETLPERFSSRRRALEDLDFTLQEWRLAREDSHLTATVETLIADTFEDARTVVRSEQNAIDDVHVSVDFMEKDQLRWWSIEELQAVLNGHGQHAGERFRPYFMPMVQLILDQLGPNASVYAAKEVEVETEKEAVPEAEIEAEAGEVLQVQIAPSSHPLSYLSAVTTLCAPPPPTERTLPGMCPVDAVECRMQTPCLLQTPRKLPLPVHPAAPTPECAPRLQNTK